MAFIFHPDTPLSFVAFYNFKNAVVIFLFSLSILLHFTAHCQHFRFHFHFFYSILVSEWPFFMFFAAERSFYAQHRYISHSFFAYPGGAQKAGGQGALPCSPAAYIP
jgi:hypothetical protein